ncbi:hypothetical protein [Caulobacter phage KcrB]|nr:hypothetical protein RW_GP043 [Caulobacter phage RW]WCA46347.1 hypothetical protein [Caulobacter phage KcrB]WCD56282.1 hypothetical protein [Caulobacter phage RLK]WNV48074.1 hypothetical protein GB2A_gp042 [Caulobacter phage GB2A]
MSAMRFYLIIASANSGLAFFVAALAADGWWPTFLLAASALWLGICGWAISKKEQDQ